MQASRRSRSERSLALTVLAGAVLLSACAGENLFSLSAAVGAAGPTVTITAPTEGFTLAAGASVQVQASASAPDGIASAKFSGVFKESGETAFVEKIEEFQNVSVVNLDKTLESADGEGTGSAFIIVEVTDQFGAVKADSVTVTVG